MRRLAALAMRLWLVRRVAALVLPRRVAGGGAAGEAGGAAGAIGGVAGSVSWRRIAAIAAALALVAAVGGFLFAWSGLYSVSASKGHWAVTRWFLEFAMRNSVETHSRAITPPPLDDPARVHLGLAHYDGGCRPCHGAPGDARNPIPVQAVPKPPYLPAMVGIWEPQELFWIVKHGLKYTGMPAWPTQERDDEVWAVVAALVQLPRMSPLEYRRWVRGAELRDLERREEDARLISSIGPLRGDLVACARCHGLRGEGRASGAFPRLAGLDADYLEHQLRAFAAGARPSGVMQPIAAELTAAEARELARFFAAQPAVPTAGEPPAEPASVRRGEALARGGGDSTSVPVCAACHGPGPEGTPRHPLYPALAGQPVFYLEAQLRLWRKGNRSSTPFAQVMTAAARSLTDENIGDLARYYAMLPPESPRRGSPWPSGAGPGPGSDERRPALLAPDAVHPPAAAPADRSSRGTEVPPDVPGLEPPSSTG